MKAGQAPRVEVSLFRLEQEPAVVSASSQFLSPQEWNRAQSFAFPAHRDQWIVARAGLRFTLAKRLGKSPKDVAFKYSPLGKPFVEGGPEFSLTHCEGWSAVAVSDLGSVGIDLESFDRGGSLLECTEEFCHPDELARLRGLPLKERAGELIKIWCAKEAGLKAAGLGLSHAPSEISVRWKSSNLAALEIANTRYDIRMFEPPGADGHCLAVSIAEGSLEAEVHFVPNNALPG